MNKFMQMELMELMESEKEQALLRIKQAEGELMEQKEGTSTAKRGSRSRRRTNGKGIRNRASRRCTIGTKSRNYSRTDNRTSIQICTQVQ